MNHNINDQEEFVCDTKVDESIEIWKNKNLSRALRTWRENEQISDVKPDEKPEIPQVTTKTEVNQSCYSLNEYTNSKDDYDSDTERELYRYRINPNSLYMD